MDPIVLIIGLFVLGLALLFVELLIPGGIVGSLGAIALVVAIYLSFHHLGVVAGIVAIVLSGIFAVLAFRFTLRRLTLSKSMEASEGHVSASEVLKELLGAEGVAHTPLRPSGIAIFEGKKVDVVTDGDMVDKDTKVKVTRVEGGRVVVRPLEKKSVHEF